MKLKKDAKTGLYLLKKERIKPDQLSNQSPESSPSQPVRKKSLGQHFLHKQSVVDHMIEAVSVDSNTSVLEIGCGEGFLTKSILAHTPCKQLCIYEIDPEWANVVTKKITDPRLKMNITNVLSADWNDLAPNKPWVLLANLPYQITFPIIFKIIEHKGLFTEGVVMVQEEVAQKIAAQTGRSYSATSLRLQYHFEFKLLEKIEPGAFNPPPKVYSRLIYFKPRQEMVKIDQIEEFWKFLAFCFKSPRQTLKNNLRQTHYDINCLSPETLQLRAQQISFDQFLQIWAKIIKKPAQIS